MPHFECGAFNHSATSPSIESVGFFAAAEEQNKPFATALLPFRFSGPLYGRPQRTVDALRGFILHPRHHVRVEIERDRNGAVAEPLLCDLRMHPFLSNCVA
jgi:hypothetical protein